MDHHYVPFVLQAKPELTLRHRLKRVDQIYYFLSALPRKSRAEIACTLVLPCEQASISSLSVSLLFQPDSLLQTKLFLKLFSILLARQNQ